MVGGNFCTSQSSACGPEAGGGNLGMTADDGDGPDNGLAQFTPPVLFGDGMDVGTLIRHIFIDDLMHLNNKL